MNEIKMPANCAYIAEEEMSYLTGGGLLDEIGSGAEIIHGITDSVGDLMDSVLCFVDFATDGFGESILGGVANFAGIFYYLANAMMGFGLEF